MCKICSKLAIKTAKRRRLRRFGVFMATFEHISQLALVFLLLTLNMQFPTGKIIAYYSLHNYPA